MFVIAVVLLAILGVQTSALVTNANSNARQQATSLANGAMEQMRALPWNVLSKGMAYNFVSAAGGDPYVSAGTTFDVDPDDDVAARTLVVAQAGSNGTNGSQDLSSPWPPLYTASGSNKLVNEDTEGRGTEFEMRTYVTEAPEDSSGAAVGIVVVVTWGSLDDGDTETTTLYSTAYAPSGGCGDLNNAPFLASCQALFYSQSSSGSVMFAATASEVPATEEDPSGGVSLPLVPGASYFSLQASTATASARAAGQQFATVDGYAQNGGVIHDDDVAATEPSERGWTTGFGATSLRASNDTVTAGAAPADPSDVSTHGDYALTSVTGTGGWTLNARADDTRDGALRASTLRACSIGVGASQVPASQPCSASAIDRSSARSSYVDLSSAGGTMTLGEVRFDSGVSKETAWSSRFVEGLAGNANTGCQVLSGAGCTSAGASRSIASVVAGKAPWDDGAAASGLVEIADYSDLVMVQRGTSQAAAAPTIARSATLRYWTESGYVTQAVTATTSGTWSVAPVTWTSSAGTVTASGEVTVSAQRVKAEGADPLCSEEACAVSAGSGGIVVSMQYLVTPTAGDPYVLSLSTTVNGITASASYKEPENAG